MIVAEAKTNSLIISAVRAEMNEILAVIERVDQSPIQLVIPMKISLVGPQGKKRILSRPHVRTLNGRMAGIGIGLDDGSRLEIELTPRVIDSDKEEE